MLVSIVVPSHNASPYLDETIRSVLEQTYTDWELIIIDDGSSDTTKAVISKYLSDPRIHYYYQERQGVSTARNNGIEHALGDALALLDADDLWASDNLEKKIGLLNSDPQVDFVYSNMYLYDAGKQEKTKAPVGRDDNIFENLLVWEGEVIPGPSSNLLIRKSCFKNGLRFDPELSTAADLDFTIQLAHLFRGKMTQEYLWSYRIAHNSMSRNIQVIEHDFIFVYEKAAALGLFKNFWFRQKCFSNMYLIVAGCWWVDGKNKFRGMKFLLLGLFLYPFNLVKMIRKISK